VAMNHRENTNRRKKQEKSLGVKITRRV